MLIAGTPTDKFELLKPDGSQVHGGKEGWAAVAQMYGPLTAQRTQPFYMVTTETEYVMELHPRPLVIDS